MIRIYGQEMPGIVLIAVKREGVLDRLMLVAEQQPVQVNQIWVGQVSHVAKGIQGCFLELGAGQTGFLNQSDAMLGEGQALKAGQAHLVQVKRLAEGGKQHLLTADVKLTGFRLIYLPRGRSLRFSKRFDGDRQVLQASFAQAGLLENGGWIVRSSASDKDLEQVLLEAKKLQQQWLAHEQAMVRSTKTRLLFSEDAVLAVIKAHVSDGIEGLYFETGPLYDAVRAMLVEQQPQLVAKLNLPSTRQVCLLDLYDIQGELERALQNRVWLKSGGYVDLQQTPAMTTVDVNTGKNNKSKAAMKANLEACAVLAQQLRLRDWGGLVAIDFANTPYKADRQALDKALRQAFADDPEPVQFQPTNAFFVAMLSRKHSGTSWRTYFLQPCPYCQATPRFGPNWTLANIHRALYSYRDRSDSVQLGLHPKMMEHIRQHVPQWSQVSSQLHDLDVRLVADPQQRRMDRFEIELLDDEEAS